MSNKTIWVAVVVVAIIAGAGLYYPQITQVVRETTREIGSVVGPDILTHLTFNQNVTNGGTAVATTSTAATFTLTTKELRREVSFITWTPNVNTTLTTMASTSAPFTDLKSGQSFDVYLYNASSTAASTITLAAGTGVDFQKSEGTADLAIDGLDVAKLTFIKKANKDIMMIMTGYTEAD